MKIVGFLLGLVLAYAGAMLVLTGDVRPAVAGAPAQHVLLLPGWGGGGSAFGTTKAQYEAAGFTVHAFDLNAGTRTGDTWRNADTVEAYIAQHGLTNVQVDGHSLGGTLVYELIRVRRNPAIVSAVTRDSNIHGPATTGFYCWEGLGVPDQCSGPVRNAILAAPPASVPVLNASAAGSALADVDCNITRPISHNDFLTDGPTTAAAITLAQGGNPCTPTTPTATTPPASPTPSPSNTPAPTTTAYSSTATATASPTASTSSTPSPTSTSAPTMIPTPRPANCSWWARLLGWCS